ESDRNDIFNKYWRLKSLQRQRDLLAASTEAIKPKYRYVRENSYHYLNNAFYFEIDGHKIRVCKLLFKSTLAKNDTNGGKEQRTLFYRTDDRTRFKRKAWQSRKDTTREFIDGGKTLADLHREYIEMCREENVESTNYVM
ncbi:hypothetical protein ILUMI_16197, partial [Ignelater luminosus]